MCYAEAQRGVLDLVWRHLTSLAPPSDWSTEFAHVLNSCEGFAEFSLTTT
jgi:hypothetical protein